MNFPFNLTINLSQSGISGVSNKNITIHHPITTFLGPNGSGKTQLLRGLKQSLNTHSNGKKVRYVSAGRLGPMENYRSDYNGLRGTNIAFDDAQYGDKKSVQRRHKNETVIGDFATLSDRSDVLIKIQERLRKLFKRDLTVDWDGGNLKVYFARVDRDSKNYSSAREASGLLHLVAILAALYDDEVGCLLIDEPEVSLHPQLQSFLLSEIVKVAGPNNVKGKKLIFISTHSTEFIKLNNVEQLASIIFCKDILDNPIQIDPTIGEFQNRKLQALLSRMGQEHKLALFCHTPLLVEGPSDQILCNAISRKLSLNIEAAGSQILPVIGKGQFPVVIKLMRLIGKKPVILADADALSDGLEIINSFTTLDKANVIASEMGHRDASKFANSIYADFCSFVDSEWEEYKSTSENHYYWINRDNGKDEKIAKRRASFCFLLNNNSESFEVYSDTESYLSIRSRLITLLDFLEKLGCFILRKGTIESYYKFADSLSKDEKPNAASNEATCLISEEDSTVIETYKDIFKTLDYCSNAEKINEAEAIRNMLLAIVTPALASITEKTTDSELKIFGNNMFGAKSSLFNLSVENNGEGLCLNIDLNTDILEVEGFPFKIKKEDNPIQVVNSKLLLN